MPLVQVGNLYDRAATLTGHQVSASKCCAHTSPRSHNHDGLWTAVALVYADAELVVAIHVNGKEAHDRHGSYFSPTPSIEISYHLDTPILRFLAQLRVYANDTERDIMSQKKSDLVPVPDEVGRLYDRFAALSAATTLGDNLHVGYWDDPGSGVPFSEAADRLTDIMAEKLKIGSGSHVLDVGCGVGGPGVRIARLTGARVTGISVSREQIAVANSLAESAELAERVVFQQADAMEMPFPAQSFDAAIALESILHMPDREQVLTQICRSLRPGGRLVLTDSFERAPIPPAKRPELDRFRNSFMFTVVQAEDYPPMLRQAGLWFEEILDITEQTLPGQDWLTARFDQAQTELEAKFGDEMTGRFNGTGMRIPEICYLMVVAKKVIQN